jgi:hypothetical protein
MHVLGHHHKAIDTHPIQHTGSLQRGHKEIAGRYPGKVRTPPVTGERDEMRQV